jgi:hypothetical protein
MHLMSSVQCPVPRLCIRSVYSVSADFQVRPTANSMTLTRKSRLISYPHPLLKLLQVAVDQVSTKTFNYPKDASRRQFP